MNSFIPLHCSVTSKSVNLQQKNKFLQMMLDATFIHPEDGGTQCTETPEPTFIMKREGVKKNVK